MTKQTGSMIGAVTAAPALSLADSRIGADNMLHIYRDEERPSPLNDDELEAVPERIVDAIEAEFRAANGGDTSKPLCVGCVATLLLNVITCVGRRTQHAPDGARMLVSIVRELTPKAILAEIMLATRRGE